MHTDEYFCHQVDDDQAAADLAEYEQWVREHNRRTRASITLSCQTTQEAIIACVSRYGADLRKTYTTAAATGFVAFKAEVDAFVDGSNADIDDKCNCLAMLDDKSMETLRREVLETEQWRLDRHCDFHIFWKSADKKGTIRMGEYRSRDAAEAAIPGAEAELLKFVETRFNQASYILGGTWEIVRVPYG